ncbi:MAG: DDE-type integrase/transposase/recombinase [bacterium]|nr:DDE-type integrase/transposase/recombinase [bacterium]
MANILSKEKRVAIVKALSEGNGIRPTSRLTGTSKNTVSKLLVELGDACSKYHDENMIDLSCKRIEADEIWSFVAMKEKTAKRKGEKRPPMVGDAWTWVAIDAESKLVPSWLIGPRDFATAKKFIDDLAARLIYRIQLTTDGLKVYIDAVEEVFGMDIDYATLVKVYGEDPEPQKRYSPAKIQETVKTVVQGDPDRSKISTSYVERQNLTMRMHLRRFTRLTNGFSKKLENHAAAISLYYMIYNFVKPHMTLTKNAGGRPTTPAMAAMLATEPWSYERVVGLLDSKI